MNRIKTSFLIAIGIFGYGASITAATLISPKQIVFMQKKYSAAEDTVTHENENEDKDSALVDVQRSMNLFNTNTGIALSAGGELNIYGINNIGTLGSGNTVTIGLNSPLIVTGALFLSSLTAGVVVSSSTGVLSSDSTTSNAVQIGNSSNTLTSIAVGTNGQVLLGATGAAPAFASLSSPTNPSGAASVIYSSGANSLSLQSVPLFGNVIRVDTINGNNSTASLTNGIPFKTIIAALAVATTGTTILILPGTYTLPSAITIPTGVNIIGLTIGTGGVTINATAITGTFITMGSNSRLENVAITISSTGSVAGISFPATTNTTATVDHVTLTASSTGAASVVQGVVSSATGTPLTSEKCALRNSTINVSVASATGAASAMGVEVTSTGNFNIMTCNIVASAGAVSTATATGVQTNSTGVCTINNSTVSGSNTATPANGNDILPTTANTIALSNTTLVNATSNSMSFITTASPSIVNYIGTAALGVLITPIYMYVGTAVGTGTINESYTQIPMQQACVVKGLRVTAGTAAGSGNTCTFTVHKNGNPGSPSLTATLSGTGTSAVDTTDAISFAAGDLLSIQVSSSASNLTANVVVTLELY